MRDRERMWLGPVGTVRSGTRGKHASDSVEGVWRDRRARC